MRRIGNIVQSKLPDGIVVLQPLDSLQMNWEIFLDQVYDRFYRIGGDDVVIDIGAHVGLFTLKAARKAKKVIAIEPHPFNFSLLLKNITFNKLRNVIPLNLAISNYNGIIKLYVARKSGRHTIYKERARYNKEYTGCLEVKSKTLDHVAFELKLDKVSFIKIDVEGAEFDVLKSARNILEKNNVFLAIATEHSELSRLQCIKMLQEIGFMVFSSSNLMYTYAFKPR